MAQPNFYNTNRGRAYPFEPRTVAVVDTGSMTIEHLSDDVVVDAGFVMGVASGFDSAVNSVWLDSIVRRSDQFIFTFVSDAPGLYNRPLGFSRPAAGGDYLSEHAEEAQGEYLPLTSYAVGETRNVQLGSTGTFVAPFSGRLQLYFNDDVFDDNSGTFSITIGSDTYTVPSSPGGVSGPLVVKDQVYDYTATGTIRWKTYPKNQDSDPDGPLTVAKEKAPDNCIAPGLVKWSLVGKVFYEGGDSAFSQGLCDDEPLWGGYLVTGKLDQLRTLLPDEGDTLGRTTGGVIEPSLVQNMARTFVSSFNIANADRTRMTAADGCPPIDWPYPTGPDVIHVNAQCLRGDVKIRPGYNATVRQQDFDNAMVLSAGVGAGEGEPCREVELFPGEIPPSGSSLLSGGLRCDEVIRTLNGVGGRFMVVRAGLGVKIDSDPSTNTITVNADMSQLSVCYDVSQSPDD